MKDTTYRLRPKTVAQKIRFARMDANLTQSALAGEYMTRNMLCRIENGSAVPSRATLAYIAEQLDLPLLYLMDDAITITEALKVTYLPHIKEEFSKGHFKECARLCNKYFSEPDDEIYLILAHASLEEAKHAVHAGNLDTASDELDKVRDYAEKTVYKTKDLLACVTLLNAIVRNVQSPRYELDDSLYSSLADDTAMADFFYYLTENADLCKNELYSEHLRARQALRNRDSHTALLILQKLEEKRTEASMGAVLLFRIYSDLEQCYRDTADYEAAYRYAGKRISMLSAFKS